MTSRRRFEVTLTHGFERDLDRIDAFFQSFGVEGRVDGLIDELLKRVVPLLQRTPRIGPQFEAPIGEHQALLKRVMGRLEGRELRTVLCGEFSVLYLVGEGRVYLLSVRHHREALFRLGQLK